MSEIKRSAFRLRLRLHFGKTIAADKKMLLWIRFNQRLFGDDWANYPWDEVGLRWADRIDAPGDAPDSTFFDRAVSRAALDSGYTRAATREALLALFDEIAEAVKDGDEVAFRRLGIFRRRRIRARVVNGVQDVPLFVGAHNTLGLKMSYTLRSEV